MCAKPALLSLWCDWIKIVSRRLLTSAPPRYLLAQQQYVVAGQAFQQAVAAGAPVEEQQRAEQVASCFENICVQVTRLCPRMPHAPPLHNMAAGLFLCWMILIICHCPYI